MGGLGLPVCSKGSVGPRPLLSLFSPVSGCAVDISLQHTHLHVYFLSADQEQGPHSWSGPSKPRIRMATGHLGEGEFIVSWSLTLSYHMPDPPSGSGVSGLSLEHPSK